MVVDPKDKVVKVKTRVRIKVAPEIIPASKK